MGRPRTPGPKCRRKSCEDRPAYKQGLCKRCVTAKARILADPEKHKEYHRRIYRARGYRFKRYGITKKLYEQLLRKQRGRCAICHTSKGRAAVDHDHETGKVRGILCFKCNFGVSFLDLSGWVIKATEYLRKAA